jgi:hypothetical protein
LQVQDWASLLLEWVGLWVLELVVAEKAGRALQKLDHDSEQDLLVQMRVRWICLGEVRFAVVLAE